MPFHPPHFQLVDNGFLVVITKPSNVTENPCSYLLSVRNALTDELKDWGYDFRDGAVCMDGSDAQVWLEYPSSLKVTREQIKEHVFLALKWWNLNRETMPYLLPSFVSVGFAPEPTENLEPLAYV